MAWAAPASLPPGTRQAGRDDEVQLDDGQGDHASGGADQADQRGQCVQGLGQQNPAPEGAEPRVRLPGAIRQERGAPVPSAPFQRGAEQQDVEPVHAHRQAQMDEVREERSGKWEQGHHERNPRLTQVRVRSQRPRMPSRVCCASQNVPSMVKLSRYAAKLGPSFSSALPSAWSEDASAALTGTRTSSTSSVIATANTPSLSAVRRSRLWPVNMLYGSPIPASCRG